MRCCRGGKGGGRRALRGLSCGRSATSELYSERSGVCWVESGVERREEELVAPVSLLPLDTAQLDPSYSL